jgi:hypothetical protein
VKWATSDECKQPSKWQMATWWRAVARWRDQKMSRARDSCDEKVKISTVLVDLYMLGMLLAVYAI